MLDDLQLINQRDPSDALGIAERQWQQLDQKFEIDLESFEVKNIVYAGMGGSALAALVSRSWPGYDIPFEVTRNYDIPKYVSSSTLFIACSYSGNTEETINALGQAATTGAHICVIAGGGKLIDIAKEKNYPFIVLPKAEQPRYAVLYNLKALIAILEKVGLIDEFSVSKELTETAEFLKTASVKWQATVLTDSNLAKQIAVQVAGKSVVVYAGPKLAPAAYKWKISFNENAKQVAWWNEYPEFNHNEFLGWTEQPPIKPYCVIDLRSNLENERVQRRFAVSAQLLSGRRPEPIIIEAQGESLIEQLLYVIMLGDFSSIYSAILSGINPVPVDLIEKFKKELG
jgi:glucose/mannose-6-phosphate isomerase